jgi:hypothetical protein
MAQKPSKGGARRKAPTGLDKVLFVRADQALLDKLESMREQRISMSPGVTLSRADVARALLWEGIRREESTDDTDED